MSAESVSGKPLSSRQKTVLPRISKRRQANRDSQIDFSDILQLTEEQLRKARRMPKVLVAARIDRDVYEWLHAHGEGYSTRINAILRAVMSAAKRSA